MTLAPPVIVEELSVCSRAVRVKGQLFGATVTLWAEGSGAPLSAIGRGIADWPDQSIPIDPAITLQAGWVVRASQELWPDVSQRSSDGATVQDRSSTTPQFNTPVVACTDLASVYGLAPGATVEVRDAGKNKLNQPGFGGPGGVALTVDLTRTLGIEVLTAQTSACGALPGTPVPSPPGQPMRPVPGQALDRPILDDPTPYACVRVLNFSDVQIGATLKIARDGGVVFWRCAYRRMSARLDRPLDPNEKLVIWQEPPDGCHAIPSPRYTVVVDPGPPPAPFVAGPPCSASQHLIVSGLVPTARVTVRANALDLCTFEAADETQMVDLGGVALSPGAAITVAQSLCGVDSPDSPAVTVTSGFVGAPLGFAAPLVECALVVRVVSVAPGSFVSLHSDKLKGRIGHALALDETVEIGVSPPLVFDDDVTAIAGECGAGRATARVIAAVDLTDPIVSEAIEKERSVVVTRVTPGAAVDVLVNWYWAGSALAGDSHLRVPLVAPLAIGQKVHAVQRLCALHRVGPQVDVQPRLPLHWELYTGAAIVSGDGARWNACRVTAILRIGSGKILAGTEPGGLWAVDLTNSTLLNGGAGWSEVRCLVAGPHGPLHVYAGTLSGLYESDTSTGFPLLIWKRVNGVPGPAGSPGAGVESVVIAKNTIVVATSAGVYWSTVPTTAGSGYTWQTDPLVQTGQFSSVALADGDSVVACRDGASAGGGGLYVGSWIGGNLVWHDTTPGRAGNPTNATLTAIVANLGRGSLAACPTSPKRVYALLSHQVENRVLALIRSGDGGFTWLLPYADPMLKFFSPSGGTINLGGDARRLQALVVDPTNPNVVVLGTQRRGPLGSTDGGVTWNTSRWPEYADDFTLHADIITLSVDATDPSGQTLLCGNDGGVFISSDFGANWSSAHNEGLPNLCFDKGETAPALSACPNDPNVLAGAMQDNGLIYVTGPANAWHQIIDVGDGWRVLFVSGNVLLNLSNDQKGLQWSEWTGSAFSANTALTPTPGTAWTVGAIAAVPYPQWRNSAGALLVAIAGDDGGTGVYGIFDNGVGASPRFTVQKLATLPFAVSGLGTLTGRALLVGTVGPNIYRLDPSTGAFFASLLPSGFASSDHVTLPAMATRNLAFAVVSNGFSGQVLRSRNLLVWELATPLPGGAPAAAVAVDRYPDPPTVVATAADGVWTSRDLGETWDATTGLPRPLSPAGSLAKSVKCEVIAAPAGRLAHLSTWGWSAWRARFQ